jgi:transposase
MPIRIGPRRYTEEFRADAVRQIQRGNRTIREVAEDLGISHWTLRDWYRMVDVSKRSRTKSERVTIAGETTAEKLARLEAENRALRKEVESLKMDRAILKKAAAFFAKENE